MSKMTRKPQSYICVLGRSSKPLLQAHHTNGWHTSVHHTTDQMSSATRRREKKRRITHRRPGTASAPLRVTEWRHRHRGTRRRGRRVQVAHCLRSTMPLYLPATKTRPTGAVASAYTAEPVPRDLGRVHGPWEPVQTEEDEINHQI